MCNTIIIVITFNCTESFLQIQLNKQRLFNTTSMFLFIFERSQCFRLYLDTYFFLFIFKQKSMFLFISERKVNVFVYI